MQPSLPVPTDNIYKFCCLFGLVLIVSSIFSFVASYSSSLDRKIKYTETVIPLKAKAKRTEAEEEILKLHQKLLQVTGSNEETAGYAIGVVMAIGIGLSVYGAKRWHSIVQRRDDLLAELQIRKLSAEVAALEAALKEVDRNSNAGNTQTIP